MNRLIHYSKKPLTRINDAVQGGNFRFKPAGLWLSVDGEWAQWCRDESFHVEDIQHATEIVLARSAKILTLAGSDQLDDFTKQYGTPSPYRSPFNGMMGWKHHDIDWKAVAANHDGVIIAPYCWNRRLELMWYYGWDCASGCIWNASAVKELRPLSMEAI